MRFVISLTEEEMNCLYFQMGKAEKHGEISVLVSEKRFIQILEKALEWKDRMKVLEESKKAGKEN